MLFLLYKYFKMISIKTYKYQAALKLQLHVTMDRVVEIRAKRDASLLSQTQQFAAVCLCEGNKLDFVWSIL